MQTKPKANSIVTTRFDADEQALHFMVRGTPSPIVLRLTDIHPDVMKRAALHGLVQRITDGAAVSMTDATGAIIPAAERDAMKYRAMVSLRDHYASGTADWNRKGASGEREAGGLVLRALAAVQGVDIPTMAARVKARAEKLGITERKFLNHMATSKDVANKMLELRGPAAFDADEALSELAGD